MADPASEVRFCERIHEGYYRILTVLTARKAELKKDYGAVVEEEFLSVIQAAVEPDPVFRNCPRPEVRKLAEEMRVISEAAERILTLEIPNNLRLLEECRKHVATVEGI